MLPGLIRRRGISSWSSDRDMMVAGEEGVEKEESLSKLPKMLPSMDPPTALEAASLHLDRCIRIVPHDQDMGGILVD